MQGLDAIFLLIQNPQIFKLGEVLRHGIVQRDFAFFDELRYGHSAESLGLGALHESVVHLDLALGGHIGVTNAASLLDSIFVKNTDGSGQLAIVHIRLQDVLGISGLGILLGLRGHREAK